MKHQESCFNEESNSVGVGKAQDCISDMPPCGTCVGSSQIYFGSQVVSLKARSPFNTSTFIVNNNSLF